MSRLRDICDRINDVEAALARIDADTKERTSLAYRLTVGSLEKRRDELQFEMDEATREGFVEVCDYRIVPEEHGSYAISAVVSVLRDFQELVTIVFDAITDKPKQRTPRDAALLEKTKFDFGFAYQGSLGIALLISNDRELLGSDMDRAIGAVFELIKSDSADQIHAAAIQYGRPVVRRLYDWSKTHDEYGLSAEIKWLRESESQNSVFVQPQEYAQICRWIEGRTDPIEESVKLTGNLASWDTKHRRFIVDPPEADSISGIIAEAINLLEERTVPARYEFDLIRSTYTDYALDQ